MKLLNKVFGLSNETEISTQTSLPVPLSTEDLHENQKRALIGWIANRMGQKMELDRAQSGSLIYQSFVSDTSLDNPNDHNQYLLYLASCLVEWIMQGEDVYLHIKNTALPDNFHNCLLETYEEVHPDVFNYVHRHESLHMIRHPKEDEVWQVYRDVIYAVTQRKFLLIQRDEVERYKDGKALFETRILERSDIPKARDLAKQTLLEIGFTQVAVMSQLLVISEAITNVLKHAVEGKMTIVETSSHIHVLVEDRGPGFPLKLLPNTILMAGYSTKKSLGQGFTLMMKMTDLILLSTIPDEGSTLILMFNRLAKGAEQNLEKHSTG